MGEDIKKALILTLQKRNRSILSRRIESSNPGKEPMFARSYDDAMKQFGEDFKKIEVILTEENLSKAIGRRGQNVRLASKLINFELYKVFE